MLKVARKSIFGQTAWFKPIRSCVTFQFVNLGEKRQRMLLRIVGKYVFTKTFSRTFSDLLSKILQIEK